MKKIKQDNELSPLDFVNKADKIKAGGMATKCFIKTFG